MTRENDEVQKPQLDTSLPGRLVSLDAYRGMTMLLMASFGFGAWTLIEQDWAVASPQWQLFLIQFNHPEWHGCTLWDLIFPSFLFVIGVAMPFSQRSRSERGQPWGRQVMHAFLRGLIIYALGDFIVSYHTGQLQTNFPVVLQKIGVCYFLAFLVLRWHPVFQIGTVILLLAAHAALYMSYSGGVGDPWAQGQNVGHYVQVNWLHLSARSGNTVLNAITGTVNVIFGILCGRLLHTQLSSGIKILVMVFAGAATMLAGWAISTWMPDQWLIPINKWLWTSSYTLWTAGFTFFLMALFYWLIDVMEYRRWAFPFVVVGMNSILVYMIAQLFRSEIGRAIDLFVPQMLKDATIAYPVVHSVLTLFVIWAFAYWLYRNRVFVRV